MCRGLREVERSVQIRTLWSHSLHTFDLHSKVDLLDARGVVKLITDLFEDCGRFIAGIANVATGLQRSYEDLGGRHGVSNNELCYCSALGCCEKMSYRSRKDWKSDVNGVLCFLVIAG
jgi:hypothetical protein